MVLWFEMSNKLLSRMLLIYIERQNGRTTQKSQSYDRLDAYQVHKFLQVESRRSLHAKNDFQRGAGFTNGPAGGPVRSLRGPKRRLEFVTFQVTAISPSAGSSARIESATLWLITPPTAPWVQLKPDLRCAGHIIKCCLAPAFLQSGTGLLIIPLTRLPEDTFWHDIVATSFDSHHTFRLQGLVQVPHPPAPPAPPAILARVLAATLATVVQASIADESDENIRHLGPIGKLHNSVENL
ncbi:uncharacterized protein K452DRAFT_313250 [Aplosporella prunicola CBS 121167]|uniref:Uncharacterized protein n=1 Tax=Aplosporella prunicola CBS 121167 TaxID=1176127 RepID=A0A6A6AZK0_9PEZI|nr:uncharacterized protein K452DRAFT_313250 [Aplosporella prunicola CBS 121167]KAF2136385.1 hypothetical protein K452DRAFT_313250 [Aplosporella prunicola CBS 121167]